MQLRWTSSVLICILLSSSGIRICSSKLLAKLPSQPQHGSSDFSNLHRNSAWPTSNIPIFLSPTFTPREKAVMRAAFVEVRRKTCVTFKEELWVPWYHWKRWEGPHIIVRPSGDVNVLAESKMMEENFNRTLMYISRKSLNLVNQDLARGIVLDQLTHILGLENEYLRPDAAKYLIFASSTRAAMAKVRRISSASTLWPFDPTSVTMVEPSESQDFRLSFLCRNVKTNDIAAGKKIGRLTFWDVVKINSIYCPERIATEAERTVGPCELTSIKSRLAVLHSKRFRDSVPRRPHRTRKLVRRTSSA